MFNCVQWKWNQTRFQFYYHKTKTEGSRNPKNQYNDQTKDSIKN
jgi:hypothetical protein